MLKKANDKKRVSHGLNYSPNQRKKQDQVTGYLRLYYKSFKAESEDSFDISLTSTDSVEKFNENNKNKLSKTQGYADKMLNEDVSNSDDNLFGSDGIDVIDDSGSEGIFDYSTKKMELKKFGVYDSGDDSVYDSCSNILGNIERTYNSYGSSSNIRSSGGGIKDNRSLIKSSLINQLDETKLEVIFMWINKMGEVSKEDFVLKFCEIINLSHKNKQEKYEIVELVNSVFELVDFQDNGQITKKEFFDFMFEQGFSKNNRSKGFFSFNLRKELRMNSSNVIVYENVNNIGIQEKRTDKFYIIRLHNFSIVGVLKMEKGITVKVSQYIPDFDEYIFVLSDKTFGRLDMKEFILKWTCKLPENVHDIIYSKKLKALYVLSVSGRVSAIDLDEYFGPNTKKIDEIGQLNYRQFNYPIQNQEDTIFETATAILWIDILKLLLIACKNLSIYVFIVGTNNEMKPKSTLNGHTKLIRKMVYSKTSRYVYSYAYDNTICVWNPLVKKYVNCINVFKDTDQIIKDISVPDNSNVLCGITEKGMCIIWETQNWIRLAVKNFSPRAMLYPFEGKPYILCGGYNFGIYEYSQQFSIQKVTIGAAIISYKYNIMYFSVQNKICSMNLSNYTLEQERGFENFDKIISLNLNNNSKQLIIGGFNGSVQLVHSFTFEIQLESKLKGLNFMDLRFYEHERQIMEVFQDRQRFIDYNLKESYYNEFNSLYFDEYTIYKSFDTVSNILLFGLVNGYVLYITVHPADYSVISFKVSDNEVCFVKIIQEDAAIIVGDKQNNNYYINLIPFAGEASSPRESLGNLKEQTTVYDFIVKKIDVFKIKGSQNYLTDCTYDLYEDAPPKKDYAMGNDLRNEDIFLDNDATEITYRGDTSPTITKKLRVFLVDSKGFLYIMNNITQKNCSKKILSISYFRTHSSNINDDVIKANRNFDLEDHLKKAKPITQNILKKRISSNSLKYVNLIDENDLIVITKNKSLKKWNIERDIQKEASKEEITTDLKNKKNKKQTRTLGPKDYNLASSKKDTTTKKSEKVIPVTKVTPEEEAIPAEKDTKEEEKPSPGSFIPWRRTAPIKEKNSEAKVQGIMKLGLFNVIQETYTQSFEIGGNNDKRKNFYFKKKFKDIPGLLGANKDEAAPDPEKKDDKVIKNYTTRQQDKLGNDMQGLIYELEKIDMLMPERGTSNNRGSSKSKNFTIKSSSKPNKYKKRS